MAEVDSSELQRQFETSPFSDAAAFLESLDPNFVRSRRAAIPIHDQGEPLEPIPTSFSFVRPHPYVTLGAPYGTCGPWSLRRSVLQRLEAAQTRLKERHRAYLLHIFDAYRPLPVQRFMIEQECERLAGERTGQAFASLARPAQREIRAWVETFWAPASPETSAPPPHSTGAALDLTIVDAHDRPLDMGTEIDELSERSTPNFFSESGDERERHYHAHRTLLRDVMSAVGFHRLPTEWWHFSCGDQMWALLENLAEPGSIKPAIYGRL